MASPPPGRNRSPSTPTPNDASRSALPRRRSSLKHDRTRLFSPRPPSGARGEGGPLSPRSQEKQTLDLPHPYPVGLVVRRKGASRRGERMKRGLFLLVVVVCGTSPAAEAPKAAAI